MAAPGQLPELVDDLVAEILLRFPPDDPSCLFRAALVCKPWRRILSGPGFRRRYREFHRAPPLLGVFHDNPITRGSGHGLCFISTAAASPLNRLAFDYPGWRIRDCRHGRVLLLDRWIRSVNLLVWNPTTGDRQVLHAPNTSCRFFGSVAVLCAMGNCDHLDCHGGPFQVVFMGPDLKRGVMEVYMYSSETGAWSTPASISSLSCDSFIEVHQSILVGEVLYFISSKGIMRYDLGGHRLSAIDLPALYDTNIALMHAEGGGLGLAGLKGHNLYLWSRDGVHGWEQRRVINLDTMLRFSDPMYQPNLMGFAEGANTIFVSTGVANYAIDLKSMQVAVVCMGCSLNRVFPYMSFYIPGELPSLLRSR